MSDANEKKLDYAPPGTTCPVATRIRVEDLPGGVRYTDPPGSLSVRYYQAIAAMLIASAVLAIVLILLAPMPRRRAYQQYAGIILVGTIFVLVSKQFCGMARRFATRPVIIEVTRLGLALNHPVDGSHYWPRGKIVDVCRELPGSRLEFLACLTIRAEGRRYRMLDCRGRAEIEWLASQLRQELGIWQKPGDGKR